MLSISDDKYYDEKRVTEEQLEYEMGKQEQCKYIAGVKL